MVSWKALQRLFSAAKDSATRDCPMMLFLEDMTPIKQINTLKRKKKKNQELMLLKGTFCVQAVSVETKRVNLL